MQDNHKKLPQWDVVFLDAGQYASEGFTNGLLLIVKNIISRLQEQGLKVGILSLVGKDSSLMFKGEGEGIHIGKDENLDVVQYLLPTDLPNCDQKQIDALLKKLLNEISPKFTLIPTPAIFMNKSDVIIRSCANKYSGKVVHVLADCLFPKRSDPKLDKKLVDQLYEEISQGEVIGLTKKIQEEFKRETGIESTYYKNPFVLKDILVPSGEQAQKYITMINTHPIKGIALFDKVARMMPDLDFMVVKNWPDVPEYNPPPNVIVKEFVRDPKEIYKNTKILLVPSLHEDGPTRVPIEALLNDIPVVASRIGSIPEFGEENYLLVNPPKIYGYREEGTILYPKVTEKDLDKAAQEYCSYIRQLLASKEFLSLNTTGPKINAWKYVYDSNQIMENLVSKWLLEINSQKKITVNDATGKPYSMTENRIPQAIKHVGLPFEISLSKLWALDIKETKMDLSRLKWHLDVPFWPDEQDNLFSVSPNDVLEFPEQHASQFEKVKSTDASYPIEVTFFKGKMLILDGLHRFTKAVLDKKEEISVRVVPPERLKEIISQENTIADFSMEDFKSIISQQEKTNVRAHC